MMKIHIRKLKADDYIGIMICFVFGFNLIMFSFNNLMRLLIGNTYYLDSILVFFVYIFFLVHAFPRILRTMNVKYLFFLLVLICLPIFTCDYSDITSKILSQIIPFCMLAFVFGIGIENYKLTWTYLYRFSWVVLGIAIFDTFVLKIFEETSHMLGYVVCFPACVLVIQILNKNKNTLLNVIGVLISCVLAIQADTSGALAAVVLMAILCIIDGMREEKISRKIISIILLCIAYLGVKNITYIAMFLQGELSKLNINVGLLEELVKTGITTDRFRNSIYEYCFSYAQNHWIWGCGVGNDRYLITNNTLVFDQGMLGNYPHNVFLEFMIQFGMIIGIIISIMLIVFLLMYILKEKNGDAKKIAILLIGMGFFPLLYSGSYIENSFFYLLIGFLWNRMSKIKTNSKLHRKRSVDMVIKKADLKEGDKIVKKFIG